VYLSAHKDTTSLRLHLKIFTSISIIMSKRSYFGNLKTEVVGIRVRMSTAPESWWGTSAGEVLSETLLDNIFRTTGLEDND
jgi:hypothetical protein